jgi:heme oxygenase (biliverdin-IX-beta and delta-forming)
MESESKRLISNQFISQESTRVQVRLRRISHPFHVRINHHPLLVGLTEPEYPLSSYLFVLKSYFHLYAALELRIQQFLQAHPVSFSYELKQPWLQEDLIYFKADPGVRPVIFPEILNMGQLIGVLYPLEGASLGGQVVSRQLKNNLGLTSSQGARFFNGYGADTALKWGEFCQFADTVQHDEALCQAAENSALLTFGKFEEALNDVL